MLESFAGHEYHFHEARRYNLIPEERMDISRHYQQRFELKYGCNPQQQQAAVFSMQGSPLPFEILNGTPGYINLLDALNAWQLVMELDEALDLPAATSFKHVSPAGAAVGVALNDDLKEIYGIEGNNLTPLATAYLRARGADPLSSFGDFIALSRNVDRETALLIRKLVSDGIIAPSYDPEALEILREKKKGGFIILQADEDAQPEEVLEYREVYGTVFRQQRNLTKLSDEALLGNLVTRNRELSEEIRRDLVLASISLKYTQSNSVGYALDGQMIGIGAGQQSRVDCTKLAGRKAETWHMRSHPRVRSLPFRDEVGNVERTNARIAFIEGEMTRPERESWLRFFVEDPGELSPQEKATHIERMKGISLSSDAFLPFRDNLDQAVRRGVQYVVQPGGSLRDDLLIEAANEYGMVMAFSGIRLFHH